MITSTSCLATTVDSQLFFLYTGASNYTLDAVLCQGEGDVLRPMEFASKLLLPAERNYSTTERKCLVVVWEVDRYRGYLECAQVFLLTDHQAFRWFQTLHSPHGRLAR